MNAPTANHTDRASAVGAKEKNRRLDCALNRVDSDGGEHRDEMRARGDIDSGELHETERVVVAVDRLGHGAIVRRWLAARKLEKPE